MQHHIKIFALLLLLACATALLFGASQPAVAQQDIETCLQYPQLDPNQPVRVKSWPPLANFVRDAPGFEGDIIGRIPSGMVITLVPHGLSPVCADGIYWWYVEWEGLTGWTAEGDGRNQYWLENFYIGGTPTMLPPTVTPYLPPVTATSTPIAPPPTVTPVYPQPTVTATPIPANCALPPRLTLGGLGRVTPGLPNLVRVSPIDLSSQSIVGRIPAGGIFRVQAGPYCGQDGRLWWYVTYQGIEGWTAEGQNGTYWLEPVR